MGADLQYMYEVLVLVYHLGLRKGSKYFACCG